MSRRVVPTLIVAAMLISGELLMTHRFAKAALSSSAACPVSVATPGVAATPAAPVSEQEIAFSGVDALFWPAGARGVVLAHGAAYDAASWRPQAEAMASAGATVLALEQTTPDAILAGIAFLRDDCRLSDITLIGASAGGSTAIDAMRQEPEAVDQLILLSATGDVSALGDAPKLFIASEGEGMAETVRQMAADAPGTENEALILPGNAHAQAIFRTEQGDALLRSLLARLNPEHDAP